MKKPSVRLSHEENYIVYTYALENKALYQNGEETTFRVPMDKIAKEINMLGKLPATKVITAHHIKTSVETVLAWEKILNKLPVLPVDIDEIDKINQRYNNKVKEIEELKLMISTQQKEIQRLSKLGAGDTEIVKMKIERIRSIINS